MNAGERALTYAVMALVACVLCVRLVGQFIAGHVVAVWKRSLRRGKKHHRNHHDKPTP